ncbi:branched-chain amino acid ABC transporter permease [Xylanimonas ulmi]|uniref:Amino acid/amide ABC transporter membrane protein 1 (HAAT family) n=1 Tax=Xylanimonas ulmi TaxID=228973 RepID=A0A4Q7M4K5_9MICO|nr:branched-chain amino acid ABC transporter permease [Xylanibacterium ulmi]RZS61562.1 amino acid/amide ABC transporter membrane protein 1 (HAAT family) [Xylanibacterium ulmi]
MGLFWQQTLDGVVSGSVYGALALSIVLVHRASGIVNFAQGEMAMLGAFLAWQLISWGAPLYAAAALAMAATFALGVACERLLIAPFRRRSTLFPLVIVTLGLMLLVNSAAGWTWGYQTKEVPKAFGPGAITIAGASVSRQGAGVIVCVIAAAAALYLLFQRTTFGVYLRAASTNAESAALSGIPVGRMLMVGWGLAAALGTLVGLLVAPQLFLHVNMMSPLLIYAFAAATLGGLDSPPGAIVGGLIVGIVENLAGTYVDLIGNEFGQGVAFLLILIVLSVKPEGLFGTRSAVRV